MRGARPSKMACEELQEAQSKAKQVQLLCKTRGNHLSTFYPLTQQIMTNTNAYTCTYPHMMMLCVDVYVCKCLHVARTHVGIFGS